MDMEGRANDQGWGQLYASSPDFRGVFDSMHAALDRLAPALVTRAMELPFPQFHHACLYEDAELVQAFLDAGIEPDTYPCTEDDDDWPPLVWLARDELLGCEDKIRIAVLLLDRGAGIDEGDPWGHALEAGDDAFADFLSRLGASS